MGSAVAGMGSGQGGEGGVVGQPEELHAVENVLEVRGRKVAARSRIVRAGVVTGIASLTVASCALSVATRWTRIAATSAAAGGRHGDVDPRRRRAAQFPQRRGRGVAERGALATREHSRHPPPVSAQCAMADGVDASVQAMETARGHAAIDRGRP